MTNGILLDDKPSQCEAGLLISNAMGLENQAAENECKDILEATQITDEDLLLNLEHRKKTRMEIIPQVDGAHDSSGSVVDEEVTKDREAFEENPNEEQGQTEKVLFQCDQANKAKDREPLRPYYVPREDVKKSNIRFSQLRQLLSDREWDSTPSVTSDMDEPLMNSQPDSDKVHEAWTTKDDEVTYKAQVSTANQTSQERLHLWREEASQVLFEDEIMLHSEDSEGSGLSGSHLSHSKADLHLLTAAANISSQGNDVASTEAIDKLIDMTPIASPPSRTDLQQTWGELEILPIVHESPHYSNPKDIGKRIQVFAGKEFRMRCSAVQELPVFSHENHFQSVMNRFSSCKENDCVLSFTPIKEPPSRIHVENWLKQGVSPLKHSLTRLHGSQHVTMDPNTGKIIPATIATQASVYSLMGSPEVPSAKNTFTGHDDACTPAPGIEPVTLTNSCADHEGTGTLKPASPKYDEVDSFYKDPIIMEDNLVSRRGNASSPYGHARRSSERLSGKNSLSRITPPTEMLVRTPESQLGFKSTTTGKGEGVTLASIEIHAASRQNLLPDPKYDAVGAIVMTVFEDDEVVERGQYHSRVLICDNKFSTGLNDHSDGLTDVQIKAYASEELLFEAFVSAVRYLDPDILMGFEIQNESLGYLAERAYYAFDNKSFLSAISRTPECKEDFGDMKEHDQYGWQTSSGLQVPGRIVLNLWRILKSGNLFEIPYLDIF